MTKEHLCFQSVNTNKQIEHGNTKWVRWAVIIGAELKPVILQMCARQLKKQNKTKTENKEFPTDGCFFFVVACLLFWGLWQVATGVPRAPLRGSREGGSELLLNPCSHFVRSQCFPPGERQITLSPTETNKYTHVLRGACKYSDTAPRNPPRRTMNEVFIKMAAPPIDIPPSRRALPQHNLHPTHTFHSFAHNCLLYWGGADACVKVPPSVRE